MSLPVKSASNLDNVVDRLLRFATAKFEIDWIYLDSEFYQGGVATKVRSEANFIIKGKKGSDKLQETKAEMLEEDKGWDDFRWGVGDVKDGRDYMFVLPEEKKVTPPERGLRRPNGRADAVLHPPWPTRIRNR